MKYRTFLLLWVFLLLAPGLFAGGANLLYLFWGNCTFQRSGWNNWLGVSSFQPMPVGPGDSIKTNDKSYAELRLADGGSINVKPESHIVFSGNSVQVRIGEIWLHAAKQRSEFRIHTPKAVCTILGTVVNVSVDSYGKTRFRVLEGIVGVRAGDDPRKRQLVLQRGMMTTVSDSKKIEDTPRKFDPEEASKELGATKLDLPKKSRLPNLNR